MRSLNLRGRRTLKYMELIFYVTFALCFAVIVVGAGLYAVAFLKYRRDPKFRGYVRKG
jgi:hypothetical protein